MIEITYGSFLGSAIGVLNAVIELGEEGIVVIGYDSGAQQIEAAVIAIQGEEIPEIIDMGFFYYGVSNIDEEIAAVLYK